MGGRGAGQQGVDSLLWLQLALDRSALFAGHVGRTVQHLNIGLATELLQGAPQRLCRDVQLDLLRLDIAGNRQRYR